MAMSKKHYQAIADVILQAKMVNDSVEPQLSKARGRSVLLQVAINLAEICKRDNAAFDKDRFMSACGFSNEH